MRLWMHIDLYCIHVVCDPEMAETPHKRRRIKDAYLHPMWRRDNTLSLGGYQLPREPRMKGKIPHWCTSAEGSAVGTGTSLYLGACRTSRAMGDPSNRQPTSAMMFEDSSGEMMVRSGLLTPDVPGRGCALGLLSQSCPRYSCACHGPMPDHGDSG